MDSEFIKLLSTMADAGISDDNRQEALKSANQLEHWVLENQQKQSFEPDTKDTVQDIKMPAYLKEQIITRSQQPDIQVLTTSKRISRRMELFLYGCKVAAAVAASLVIMVTTAITQNQINSLPQADTSSLTQTENEIDVSGTIMEHLNGSSEQITSWLQNFSSNIMKPNQKKTK